MTRKTTLAALLAATALTACGSGTSSSFFIGTTGADRSAAGFAEEGMTADALAGKTILMPFVYATDNPETGEHGLFVATPSLKIGEEVDLNALTVTLNGVDYELVDGEADVDGASVSFYLYEDGDYVAKYNFYGNFADGTDFDGMGVIGFQTDPDTIAGLADTVTYLGDFQGWGNFIDANGDVDSSLNSIGGDVVITADFSTGTLSGVFGTSDLYASDGGEDVSPFATFAFEDAIIGNGFEADLTLSCSEGFTCDGGGTVGGAFFGPDAEEVGGIAAFEGTVTAGDDVDGAISFEHPGSFVTLSDPEPDLEPLLPPIFPPEES